MLEVPPPYLVTSVHLYVASQLVGVSSNSVRVKRISEPEKLSSSGLVCALGVNLNGFKHASINVISTVALSVETSG